MGQGSLEPEQALPQPSALSGRPALQDTLSHHTHRMVHAAGPRLGQGQLPVRYKGPTTSSLLGATLNSQHAQLPAQGPRCQPRTFLVHTDTFHRSSSGPRGTHQLVQGKYCVAREQRRRSSVSRYASAAKWPCDLGTPCHLCHSVSPSVTKPVGCVPSEAGWHCHQASSPEEGPSFWRP